MEDRYFDKACDHYSKKEFEDAIRLFSYYQGYPKKRAETLYYIGISFYELKKLDKSLDNFNTLIKEYSSQRKMVAKSWYYKGLILYELRNNYPNESLLKKVFNKYNNVSIDQNKEAEEFQKLVENESKKFWEDYKKWDDSKKARFAKFLMLDIKPETKKVFQKVFDIESQIAFENALCEYNFIKLSQSCKLKYEKAFVLDELKRYDEAIGILDECLGNSSICAKAWVSNPIYAEAWLKKGTILFKLGKYEEAKSSFEQSLKYFEIAIKKNSKNTDHCYNKGIAHSSLAEVFFKIKGYDYATDQYEKAVTAFDKATIISPNFALAWNNKGNAYLKLKKHNKAIEAFEKAYEINRNYYLALNNKGDALYSLGKYEEAIEIYKQATGENDNKEKSKRKEEDTAEENRQINTVSYKSYNNKGLALYKLGRYDEAIKAFGEALHINPTFANNGLTNKGLVFYKLEMFPEAKKAFEEALEIEPGNVLASNNLGIVLAKEGEVGRAKKLFENTIQENPHFILGHANLAELLLNSGGIKEASGKIKNIIEDEKNPDPNMGYIYFLDGRVKIEDMENKENRYSKAAKSFEKAVSYNVEEPTFLLWSVYAKSLCQKFEVGGETDSSEKPEPREENVSSKVKDIYSDEFFNSIISDLERILNFCNAPMIKKNSMSKLTDKKLLWKIILTIVLSYGILQLSKIFMHIIQNGSDIQIINYLGLVIIVFVALLIIINRKLLWPITVTIITIFGLFNFLNGQALIFLILTVLLLLSVVFFIVIRLINKELLWPLTITTLLLVALFGLFHFFSNQVLNDQKMLDDQTLNYLSIPNMLIILLLILTCGFLLILMCKVISSLIPTKVKNYTSSIMSKIKCSYEQIEINNRLISLKTSLKETLLKVQVKTKENYIKFDRYQEIKAYTLYLLGYFYYKLKDYTTAKEKLQECINLRPEARTDKAASELLDGIWKYKIKPPFWTYWFNSPVKTWRRRAFGTFIIFGILLILFIHPENPQPVAWNDTVPNSPQNFIPDQINFYPYIISYPPSNTSSGSQGSDNATNGNDETTWNILTPARVNIYPDIPGNYFDAILLLLLILILISPSVRIAENIKLILKKGADVSLDLGPIAAPPEFNFELSPSLMQDVIRRLDENL